MATECVTVKKEPVDLPEEGENVSQFDPADGRNGPEFVNIKMEVDVPGEDARIKSEYTYGDGKVPAGKETGSSWEVPVESRSILPGSYVEVSIKVEPDDEFDEDVEDPPSPQVTSLDGLQGVTNSEDGYVCRICLKRFANPGNVQRHMLLHAKQKHNCTECPKQFLSLEQLEKHKLRHSHKDAERNYGCEHCQKKFKSSSNLMQHKRVHLEVKPHFCPQCHRTFAFKANLVKHQGKSRCKRPVDEPIVCHVCNKVFEREFLLKSHLRRHDTERPFSCDQCTMTFKYKSTLIRHIQLHNGVRPFNCPVCDKSFTHSGLLKPHMRVHTGEKPYQCPICSKYFAHKHNMQRHATRHNKIKHLVCDICHKQFPKESRLKYHMRTHVNEKHFACQICPKRFSHKQNVIRHYSRKHPNAKYDCTDTDASVALKVWDTFKNKYSEDPEQILS